MNHTASLERAVELAKECLAGRLTPLQTASNMRGLIDPWHPAWEALGGVSGPLPAFYSAADLADNLHFLGEDVERWHPSVREMKRKELADAEAQMAAPVQEACRALIIYAESIS